MTGSRKSDDPSAAGISRNAATPAAAARHIPYRDSKLTRLLQESLGGNARTSLIICCSGAVLHASETFSTLRFGARASKVQNHVVVNRVTSAAELASQLQKAESAIDAQANLIRQLKIQLLRVTKLASHLNEANQGRFLTNGQSALERPETSSIVDAAAGPSASLPVSAATSRGETPLTSPAFVDELYADSARPVPLLEPSSVSAGGESQLIAPLARRSAMDKDRRIDVDAVGEADDDSTGERGVLLELAEARTREMDLREQVRILRAELAESRDEARGLASELASRQADCIALRQRAERAEAASKRAVAGLSRARRDADVSRSAESKQREQRDERARQRDLEAAADRQARAIVTRMLASTFKSVPDLKPRSLGDLRVAIESLHFDLDESQRARTSLTAELGALKSLLADTERRLEREQDRAGALAKDLESERTRPLVTSGMKPTPSDAGSLESNLAEYDEALRVAHQRLASLWDVNRHLIRKFGVIDTELQEAHRANKTQEARIQRLRSDLRASLQRRAADSTAAAHSHHRTPRSDSEPDDDNDDMDSDEDVAVEADDRTPVVEASMRLSSLREPHVIVPVQGGRRPGIAARPAESPSAAIVVDDSAPLVARSVSASKSWIATIRPSTASVRPGVHVIPTAATSGASATSSGRWVDEDEEDDEMDDNKPTDVTLIREAGPAVASSMNVIASPSDNK